MIDPTTPHEKLLILDLDETLIFATDRVLARAPDFSTSSYAVYKRPHLDVFLDFCREHFRVGVWTSAGPRHAHSITSHIFAPDESLEFIWDSRHCSRRYDPEMMESYSIKKLAKLKRKGYDLEQTLVVDDTPKKHQQNYGNLIRIEPWIGDEDDRELERLMLYLLDLKPEPNVRALEKRRWWVRYPLT
jgi:RNA polymerase II subunit A small phosphatase-like protein